MSSVENSPLPERKSELPSKLDPAKLAKLSERREVPLPEKLLATEEGTSPPIKLVVSSPTSPTIAATAQATLRIFSPGSPPSTPHTPDITVSPGSPPPSPKRNIESEIALLKGLKPAIISQLPLDKLPDLLEKVPCVSGCHII